MERPDHLHPCACSNSAILDLFRATHDILQQAERTPPLSRHLERMTQDAFEVQSKHVGFREQACSSRQQADGRRVIHAPRRPFPCPAKPFASLDSHVRRVVPHGSPADDGSLEMEADELVGRAMSVEPAGERLMHRCPFQPADRVVGGLTDERVDELVFRPARTDEPPPL
jgi:hypothetical protein